ncbi:MAG: PEP-CTERM sorting domain-containing protein [Myxococcota bacterium]
MCASAVRRVSPLPLLHRVARVGFVAALATTAFAGSAAALSIAPTAFTGTQTVESFEGIVLGANVGASPFANILEPGTVGAYTFASGVTLSAPVPNPGTLNNGVFVHDFALPAGASNNWGANGAVSSAANVPFGTAYLGAFDGLTGGTSPVSIRLTFGTDVLRVGAYATGASGLPQPLRMDAYDAAGILLESVTLGTVPVANWGSNFFGIERAEGIRSVVFSGADFGIDGLTFEGAVTPVPEPGTALLVGLGLAALGAGRRR